VVTDEELLERYPWGAIDHDNKAQWKGYLDRRLVIDRCLDCGHWINPPRPMCPKCWSTEVEAQEVSGKGKVQWFTLLYQGHPAADPANPYPQVVVELDEQPNLRLDSTVVDCPPHDIACDMPVELTWIGPDDAPLPAFRPRGD
jgi:uncharacterized OB-fold protein